MYHKVLNWYYLTQSVAQSGIVMCTARLQATAFE